MSDYIKREDAIDAIYSEAHLGHSIPKMEYGIKFANMICALPSADVVERKCGEWEGNRDNLRCSECGKDVMDYFHFTEDGCLSDYPNFCPNCGADMRERKDND